MIRLAVVNDEALLRTSGSSSTRPTRSRSSRRLVPAVDIVCAERPDVVLLDIYGLAAPFRQQRGEAAGSLGSGQSGGVRRQDERRLFRECRAPSSTPTGCSVPVPSGGGRTREDGGGAFCSAACSPTNARMAGT